MNLGQVLHSKIEEIIQDWVETVCQDGEIEPPKRLTFEGVRNNLPGLLETLVSLLSNPDEKKTEKLTQEGLEHGVLRAEQGYDPEEIAREYRLLRQIIFSHLEPELLTGTAKEVFRAVRLIDTTIDAVIAKCFKSYTKARLQDLEQLYDQLELTNQELGRLVEAHQDNFSKLAHELKNPLTSVIGYSELFLRQQRQSVVMESTGNFNHIERVLRGGRQILHLINDALEVSRYKAGKMQLRPASVNICAVIDSVVEALEPIAAKKGIELLVTCPLSKQPVLTDTLRLQQVLTNLVSNAIRYTNTGTVKVFCRLVSQHHLAITVADTGVGISLQEQAKIFEPFYRVAGEKSSPESTGLGLAIVLQLVELLQGEIELDSEVGKGSSFTITLPLQVKTEGKALSQQEA